jgi:hypothetical protein
MSGSSIWASVECNCCFWIAGGLVSYLTMWLLTLRLFKNSIDTQEKLRLNLHALIECECEWAFRIQALYGADHLIFEGGGGGVEDSVCARIIFRPRGIRQIFFSCKSAVQVIFSQYISRQDIFFCPLIITAYSNLRLSYSYRQRRSRGFQSEEAENWIPRGAKEFSLRFILYGYVLMFPTLKRAGLLAKNV